MNKKEFSLIQHYLIPAALVAANMAVVHLIYLLAKGAGYAATTLIFAAALFLAVAIIKPNKYLLLASVLFYALALYASFIIH